MSASSTRAWYVQDGIVDEYKSSIKAGGSSLPMIKALKIIRAIVVNVGLLAIGGYGVLAGGDPTLLPLMTLAVVGAYNGLELGDYMALLQAYKEVQEAEQAGDDD